MKTNITPEEFKLLSEKEKIEYMSSIKNIVNIYTIYDRVAEKIGTLFTGEQEGAIVRSFEDEIKNERNGDLFKHPEDFELWKIGEINMKTGEVTENKKIVAIGKKPNETTK
ncbi:MAG: hypothetical protein HDQ88_04570 [Clostridia bacterium]|nr:hypothetical protein [Clostridia bacterium]